MLTLLEKEREALEAGGLNVRKILTALKKKYMRMRKLAAEQESSKHHTLEITKELNKAKHEAYVDASGALDMAIGAVDKDSPVAKTFRRRRSGIRRRKRKKQQPAQTAPE